MSTGAIPAAAARPADRPPAGRVPAAPTSLAETGLEAEFVSDLILKTLYTQGPQTGRQLLRQLKLPLVVVDDLLHALQQRRLIEVLGTSGVSRAGYRYDLSGSGREHAREAFASSHYVGAAPVPLAQYQRTTAAQSISLVHVTRADVDRAFKWLVLNQETLDEVGPAINSGRSLFLYGESGNGKTAIAETIAGLLGGDIYVPYAIEVDGQIIVVYDPVHHTAVDPDPAEGDGETDDLLLEHANHDQRWVHVRRPVVFTGGELTLDQLDLQYDTFTKLYQAPFQVKANGGVLIIDDFGRQRVPPRDLLNRWIVPLEKRVDYLTLHTGGKFPVPFDCLVVIATNINPRDLVEEAFLRRIHYKIRVESPTVEQYEGIFEACCGERGIAYSPDAVRQVYRNFYHAFGIAPRGCHPRDLLDHLVDISRYLEVPPTLSQDLVERAGRSYFLDFPTTA